MIKKFSFVYRWYSDQSQRQSPATNHSDLWPQFSIAKIFRDQLLQFLSIAATKFLFVQNKIKNLVLLIFHVAKFSTSFLHIWRSSKWKTKKTKKSWKKKIVSSSIIKWLLFFFFVVDLIYNSCVADMGGISLGTLFDNVFINAFTLKDMGSSPRYYDIDRLTNVTVVLKHCISFFDFILVDFENLSCSAG